MDKTIDSPMADHKEYRPPTHYRKIKRQSLILVHYIGQQILFINRKKGQYAHHISKITTVVDIM